MTVNSGAFEEDERVERRAHLLFLHGLAAGRRTRRRRTALPWPQPTPTPPGLLARGDLPIDTVCELTCAPAGDRWQFTVTHPAGRGSLQQTVASVDDIPFAAVDLLATHHRFRTWRLRLTGPDLPALFAAGRSGRRTRTDHTRQWIESWTALVHGDAVIVALRAVPLT